MQNRGGNPNGSAIGMVSGHSARAAHANRVSTTNNLYHPRMFPGILFYETDRGMFYISALVSNVWTWIYAFGEGAFTQATLPGDLGANDAGFLAEVYRLQPP
jgi:hypothetical protein